MKLGCMLYSFSAALADESLTVPDALGLIREFGGKGADIMHTRVADYTPTEIKNMLDDNELAIAAWIGGANLTVEDIDQRHEAIHSVKQQIDRGVAVGAQRMLVTTGGCASGQDKAACRRNVADGLGQLLPYAADRGITLSIEDFGSPAAPYQTSDECLETCKMAGDELMITYDSGNMVMGDEDPVQFLYAVQDRIVHGHAKDWRLLDDDADARLVSRAGRKYTGTVVGRGVLDYPAIIEALKDIEYEGFLSFEYEGSDDPVAAAREGMGYLRELME